MRYVTRTFLSLFVPMAALLFASFWVVERLVESAARTSFRASLRETQAFLARQHEQKEWSNVRSLRVVAESAALKAALQLVRADPANPEARATLADQLSELNETLDFEVLAAATPEGRLLAGWLRTAGGDVPLRANEQAPPLHGLWAADQGLYQITAVPVNLAGEHIGNLSVGERIELSHFATPVALEHRGRVIRSTVPDVSLAELTKVLRQCRGSEGRDVRLRGAAYHCLPMHLPFLNREYRLVSLHNMDRATAPTLAALGRVFAMAEAGALLAALLVSLLTSRSVVKPISGIVGHLRAAEQSGRLGEFAPTRWRVRELDELAECFRRASVAIRAADERLHAAYLQFVASIASALDARDHYTAGHSYRVSELSRQTAEVMGFSPEQTETIRVAALLHDIGKIGIRDAVLQKPGRLTEEERKQIELHPLIGRRILEQVTGFEAFLAVVELHHENWDGTGYPYGLRGEEIPLAARIVHVVDAYDAMTSDRPYRPGMSGQEALEILNRLAGTYFDPAVVAVFSRLCPSGAPEPVEDPRLPPAGSWDRLAAQLGPAVAPTENPERKRRNHETSLLSAGLDRTGARTGSSGWI